MLKKRISLAVFFLFLLVTATFADDTRLRLLFIGDVMAHTQQLEAAERGGAKDKSWNFLPQFRRVKPLSKHSSDPFIVANLETTFSGGRVGYAGYPSFNTPDSLTDALKDLGVHVVTLANNHILDRGSFGARRTTEVLDRAGILWTGLGLDDVPKNQPLLVEHSGFRLALLSYSYGSNRVLTSSDVHLNVISEQAIAEGLEKAKLLSPDFIIACFHWGNEYQYSPSAHQKKAAEAALKHGADILIGTHPHVLQPVEVVRDKGNTCLVVWSLGNFVSFQRTLPRERSCVLAVDVLKKSDDERASIESVSLAPTRVSVVPAGNRRSVEVVYAGKGGNFNHAGLSKSEVKTAQDAGSAVLSFLGADTSLIDEHGFYTLWDSSNPEAMPKSTRSSPK